MEQVHQTETDAIIGKVSARLGYDLNKAIRLLLSLIEQTRDVPGDIAEFGIYQGATMACAAMYLKERRIRKTIYGFDSFTGLPQYHPYDMPEQFDRLLEQGKITREHHRKARARFSQKNEPLLLNHLTHGKFSDTSKARVMKLLDDLELLDAVSVKIFEGLFTDTLGNLPEKLSLAFLDCDLYESYLTCLAQCYPRMSRGGVILLDEYYSLKYPGARVAVDEFFSDKSQKPSRMKTAEDDAFERWYVQF